MSPANVGWRDYWKEDRRASCEPLVAETGAEIEATWRRKFQRLPNGSRILDVATGNGIVLAHAAQAAAASGKQFALTGVDLAEIDPPRYVSSLPPAARRATFLGGVSAEALPFDAGAFNVVASQYGLEYADLSSALQEVERVLSPGGSLLWLTHTSDSAVVAQNRDDGAQVDLLLAADGPLAAMRQFVAAIRRRRRLQSATAKLRSALETAERYCAEQPPAKVVREVCTVLADIANRAGSFYVGDLERMLDDCSVRLTAHRQRIEDLNAAVLGPARQAMLRDRLTSPVWRDASFDELRVGSSGASIGLFIEVQRAAA